MSRILLTFFLITTSNLGAAERLMVPGVPVPADVRAALESDLSRLENLIDRLEAQQSLLVETYLPDVVIYHKAVAVVLRYDEFIRESEFEIAASLIDQGMHRAQSLLQAETPWRTQTGLVVRGYRSRIDDSVQPYGLVVPSSFASASQAPHRADVWLHGRDNRLTELKFIDQRQNSAGRFVPDDTIVLHPYGRFCNAFKFAGEVDVFEALEAMKRDYPIDLRRIAIRGFSMGGAGCWHLAVHHPSVWAAAAPGAGFAESADYLGLWQKEPKPSWFQQTLWHFYDATDYALNLFHIPTVAYSGEIDKQIQAAQMMAAALSIEGMNLRHVIGPKTGHTYHPAAHREISDRIDAIVAKGKETVPRRLRFTTWTTRYSESHWIQLLGLQRHWSRARVDARIDAPDRIDIRLENVASLRLKFEAVDVPFLAGTRPKVIVNGEELIGPLVRDSQAWEWSLESIDGRWRADVPEVAGELQKRPGLQGPIDDAFMDRFVIVEPVEAPPATSAGTWIATELTRLKREWRAQFRGEPLVVRADKLNSEHVQNCHLILFGDPSTNPVIKRVLSDLPFEWNSNSLRTQEGNWPTEQVVPLMIYPNPLNPDRYVVLNSGFTFRGFGSNATQVPMLPDYAFIDTQTPASDLAPGKILEAGFFDEAWAISK